MKQRTERHNSTQRDFDRFHMIGHIQGLHPQAQKFEPPNAS